MMDALKKAVKDLEHELHVQVGMCYGSAAIAFYEEWGFGTKKITTIMNRTGYYWDKCGESNEISMLEMLENETGIEIRNSENGKSWHDLGYINAKIKFDKLNRAQLIYMRQRQKEWVQPQVVACLLYTMHRRYEWGETRMLRLLQQMEDIKARYDYNPDVIRAECLRIVKIRLLDEQ